MVVKLAPSPPCPIFTKQRSIFCKLVFRIKNQTINVFIIGGAKLMQHPPPTLSDFYKTKVNNFKINCK